MSDYMELGDSGLIPQDDGWYMEKSTGNMIDPEGRVYDASGEKVYDPSEDDYDR